MMIRLRNVLLFSAAAVAAVVSAADGESSSSPPEPHQLDATYNFEQYLIHLEKTYTDRDEYDRRSRIFAKNLGKILAHNEAKQIGEDGRLMGEGYIMGVNMFTDVESHELPMGYNKLLHPAWRDQLSAGAVSKTERKLGATDTDTDTEAYSKPIGFEMEDVSALPDSVDWSAEGKVSKAPNQGGCGSCWSFAATAAIESHLAIATGEKPFGLSEQNMLQCSPNPDHCGGTGGCTGSTVELALNYIADITAKKTGGMFNITDVPYSGSNQGWGSCEDVTKDKSPQVGIEGWTALETNDYKAVMNAVAKVGPLAVAVAASGWSYYQGGVFHTTDTTVNHAVVLVGYGTDEETKEKYWKIRNSWGPSFGEEGYIRVLRTDGDDQVCGQDTDPLVGMACALDDNGNKIETNPVKVCGTGAVLFDASYPVGVHRIKE